MVTHSIWYKGRQGTVVIGHGDGWCCGAVGDGRGRAGRGCSWVYSLKSPDV